METHYKLTEREQSTIRLFAEGLTPEQVAEQMAITTEQVEQIAMTVLHKLFAGSVLITTESSETPAEALVGV
ncbi:MAG: LuxR C-terminal-related transcriptional regulator [Fimbriimonadales bacterium]|nr:LuxR C-terminal-related transcriptional regulator [Fimbriimonadales bacterium]